MSPIVITLALTAALAHATWNAFLRSGADRFWVVTVMSLTMMVVALPFAFVLPLPTEGAWPFLLLSSVLQVVYSLFLVAAYRHGDLGQVYPIIRGTVPILVTAGGFLFAGDVLHPAALAGIVVIACGVMALAVGRGRATSVSIRWALGAGALVATYATVDVAGVRQAGDPLVYTVWISLLYGALLWLAFAVIRGRIVVDLQSSETWKAAGGGMVSLAAYGLVVAAYLLGPAGGVTALRETSVVFAALIGTVFLGEALTWRRLLACLAVVGGAISISYPG